MNKELFFSLRKLNFIVLKKIAQKRGYRVGGSRNAVDINEMESLLNTIKTRMSLKKLISIYSLVILITLLLMGFLLNIHLEIYDFYIFNEFFSYNV